MCLDVQCSRCQGYFRNYQQIVRRGAEVCCVQCDAAIEAGAASHMYDHQLGSNSIFDHPELFASQDVSEAGA